jgi:hypothetical protein
MDRLPTAHAQEASTNPSTEKLRNSKQLLILKCLAVLFGSYRVDQFSDTKMFQESASRVLAQYPNDIIKYVTDPLTGLQRKHKFVPSIAEIIEACDERFREISRVNYYQNWGKADADAIRALNAPREDRLSLDELKAKYPPNWGIDAGTTGTSTVSKPAPSWDAITQNYASDPSRLEYLTRNRK